MSFVKVRDANGREADVTAGEVAYYRSIGFHPVGASTPPIAERGVSPSEPSDPMQTPANDIVQRLDLVLDEIRGLRADLAVAWAPGELTEPADGEPIELREPGTQQPVNLDRMNRTELNAFAATVGITDLESFKTNAALIEAIKTGTPARP